MSVAQAAPYCWVSPPNLSHHRPSPGKLPRVLTAPKQKSQSPGLVGPLSLPPRQLALARKGSENRHGCAVEGQWCHQCTAGRASPSRPPGATCPPSPAPSFLCGPWGPFPHRVSTANSMRATDRSCDPGPYGSLRSPQSSLAPRRQECDPNPVGQDRFSHVPRSSWGPRSCHHSNVWGTGL